MSSWAKPGVKCVCVDGRPHRIGGRPARYAALPSEGVIYTVQSVRPYRWSCGTVGIGIDLAEVRREVDGQPVPFGISRFRPLITQEQDVELFRHLLSPSPIDVGLIPAGVELDA